MAFDPFELRLGILRLFAEAQGRLERSHSPRLLAAVHGLRGRVLVLKPAEIRKPRKDACPFCGSLAPDHRCAEFAPAPAFAAGPRTRTRTRNQRRRPVLSRAERAWRPPELPPHDPTYKCQGCGSPRVGHRCPTESRPSVGRHEPGRPAPEMRAVPIPGDARRGGPFIAGKIAG